MKHTIGILGSGTVGIALANGFIKHGYDVMIGTNTDSKKESLLSKTNGKAKVGNFQETAAFGTIIVLAVKGNVADAVLNLAGAINLKGKIVIDTTNPIAEIPPVHGVINYFTDFKESLMERLQKQVPEARFVKSFSCIGSSSMVNPDFNGVKPTMFICGSDDSAKNEVKEILDLFGFETEDMGNVEAARAIEPLAMLWCIPGFLRNDWSHAFKVLRK